MTLAKYACNVIELAVWSELLSEGRDLPSSWEEIPTFRDKQNNLSEQNASLLRQINSFAIVPNSQLIQSEQGVSSERSNHRLFAISRDTDVYDRKLNDMESDRGRYVILVTPDHSEIRSSWIKETEAQTILNQIKGFDPKLQPVAFPHIDRLENERKSKQDHLVRELNEHVERLGQGNSTDIKIPVDQYSDRCGFSLWLPIIGGVAVVMFLIWMISRRSQKFKNAP